jgi:hypothetical protein
MFLQICINKKKIIKYVCIGWNEANNEVAALFERGVRIKVKI